MEYTSHGQNWSPIAVGTYGFANPYFGIPGHVAANANCGGDLSMDSDVQSVLKLKQIREDIFSWTEDKIRNIEVQKAEKALKDNGQRFPCGDKDIPGKNQTQIDSKTQSSQLLNASGQYQNTQYCSNQNFVKDSNFAGDDQNQDRSQIVQYSNQNQEEFVKNAEDFVDQVNNLPGFERDQYFDRNSTVKEESLINKATQGYSDKTVGLDSSFFEQNSVIYRKDCLVQNTFDKSLQEQSNTSFTKSIEADNNGVQQNLGNLNYNPNPNEKLDKPFNFKDMGKEGHSLYERTTEVETVSNLRIKSEAGNIVMNSRPDQARPDMDLLYLADKSQMAATGGCGPSGDVGVLAAAANRKRRCLETAWPMNGKRQSTQNSNQANHRDMISAGRISSEWQVDELDIDLSSELPSSYNMSEALLNLPSFKQEAPSPTETTSPPRPPPWLARHLSTVPTNNAMMAGGMGVNGGGPANCNAEQHSPNHMSQMANGQAQGMIPSSGQSQSGHGLHPGSVHGCQNPSQSFQETLQQQQAVMDVANGLLLCSPHGSLENYAACNTKPIMPPVDSIICQDNRFQYVLAAATSIATKCNEDTLTYLNQCQSYEIKLKKLGDLSHYRGKILKTIIRICFHERRLQFAEREQMSLWQSERPGERIVEVDVPLSYGLIHVSQPSEQPLLNTVELYWDPVKEAGVYIKVNCISTEFTAKKHGGEKGVPFRIQVETFLPAEGPPGSCSTTSQASKGTTGCGKDRRLHAAACQIKVFKLKGADRKHKQDKEKILRRPPSERDKYQPSCECTFFTDLSSDAVFSPIATCPPYSPEQSALPARPSAPSSASPPRVEQALHHLALSTPLNDVKLQQTLSRVNSHGSSLDGDEEVGCRAILGPSSPQDIELGSSLTESSTAAETRSWLAKHRFSNLSTTFTNYSGADLLRLSRDDLIQICSVADGIRLYNALHAERAPAKLTIYAKKSGEKPYSAIYMRSCQASELRRKLTPLLQESSNGTIHSDISTIYVSGPNGIRIHLTDEVIQNFKNDSMFRLDTLEDGVLMKPT